MRMKREENGNLLIERTFYEKPMKSGWVNPANSAMDEDKLCQILSNDIVRRLMRVDSRRLEEDYGWILDQYDEKLMFSDVFCDMVNDQVYGTNYPDVTKKELQRISETSLESMGTK